MLLRRREPFSCHFGKLPPLQPVPGEVTAVPSEHKQHATGSEIDLREEVRSGSGLGDSYSRNARTAFDVALEIRLTQPALDNGNRSLLTCRRIFTSLIAAATACMRMRYPRNSVLKTLVPSAVRPAAISML